MGLANGDLAGFISTVREACLRLGFVPRYYVNDPDESVSQSRLNMNMLL